MRLVYVYRYNDPEERRYLFRRPLVWAWLLSHLRPEYDYKPFWWQGSSS
ncbi:hypothetical protein OG381_34480 [Streptomyces sp. NBC_00490]